MKKIYIKPIIEEQRIVALKLMSGSGVTSNNGIEYAGIDEDGTEDPDANNNDDIWDDEDY